MAVEDSWYMTRKGEKLPTKRHGRGKRWRVRNTGAPTESYEKKTDAEARDTVVKNDLLRGIRPYDHKAGRILFKDYARKCVKERYHNRRSLETAQSRLETHLIPYFGEKRMNQILPSTVSSFRAKLRDKPKKRGGRHGDTLSARTIEGIDTLLITIMLSADSDDVIPENPCAKATPRAPVVKRPVEVWEQEIVDDILDAVPERYRTAALTSATCGHRQGESFAIAKDDILFLRKKIRISHQVQRVRGGVILVPPKGGKIRTVPMADVASTALAEHIRKYGTTPIRCECCGIEQEILLTTLRGTLVAPRYFNRDIWTPAVKGAGLTPVPYRTGQHQLRHYYASTLIEGGASMEQVRDYMGHASITVTAEIYGHLFKRSHDKARSIIDDAFSRRTYPGRTAQDQ